MSLNTAQLEFLAKKGLSLADAIELSRLAEPAVDEVAERRRAYDRERKRSGNSTGKLHRNSTGNSPLNDNISKPPVSVLPSDEESTGAEAPDSDQIFWANAKAFIKPEVRGDPGALIGRWAREFTKPATAEALTRAQIERPVQRIPFIEAILRKSGQKSQPTVPL